jgi:hypothetical protein
MGVLGGKSFPRVPKPWMTSVGLGEMFGGDFAETCTGKFSLMLTGGRAEGLACYALYYMHFIICKVFYEFYSMHS